MTSTADTEPEVIVVGGRCAGAATAMLLAREGHDVLVVDRATFPSDTLSTHAIARGGVVQLARWGLLDAVDASGVPPVRSLTFHVDGEVVRRTVKRIAGVDHLVAPRRYVLDAILQNEAIEAGAQLRTATSVTGVVTDGTGRVSGVTVRDGAGNTRRLHAPFVVGADGVWSRIARAVGAWVIDERPSDGATHYLYVAGLESDGFEFHVGRRGYAGLFPTHGGEAALWVCAPATAQRGFHDLLERVAPTLARRVDHATVTAPVRSAVRYPNQVRQAAGPGWALVGDAGYHRDPITGHGITDAFRDAELLARALSRALRGDTSEATAITTYATERDRALAPIFDVTCQLSSFPDVDEFVAAQHRLSDLLEAEAIWLAGLSDFPQPHSTKEQAA